MDQASYQRFRELRRGFWRDSGTKGTRFHKDDQARIESFNHRLDMIGGDIGFHSGRDSLSPAAARSAMCLKLLAGGPIEELRRLWRHLSSRPQLRAAAAQFIDERLPYLVGLVGHERRQLHRLVALFLNQKRFEAAAGMRLDDAVRWTIAGQACLLHLGIEGPLFPTLRTVIVYPGTYRVEETLHMPEGTQLDVQQLRAGESWSHGTLVLSWRDVLEGLADPADGWNVVFHEFAHQLDEETGESNGAPALPSAARYEQWQRVFQAAFRRLQQRIERGADPSPFDDYDAESPAEFFAAATELFFEAPKALTSAEAEVYAELARFYGQDPAARRSANASPD